ncbi:sigma-70 family RNA polymerase sigma factor [Amycolatopsis sp. PS_44_ISF1]|uniref:RNA polymerase sigma factor n=1 Tax=Amycolatopsis sp. PS_44_ISF1 TaxID=2974917 RepID=UPI0028E0513A|nr:sigma-70 family RNA polymerase sigma factor [Amycolatopsis sp. PS_44_ISF1]MDT8911047.1 sigma-70 family RNA polymerase sigma factor [Amycolatopsis sp. PS_44_ISF1]
MWGETDLQTLSALVVRTLAADPGLRADAEDACQSAWLELLRRPVALRDQTRLGGWLTTVARRHAARAIARRTRGETGPDHRPPLSPEPAALAAEEATALWRAVSRLPERHRRLVVMLAYYPELSPGELARELGIAPASVSTLRRRCLAALRRHLVAEGFGGR